MTPSTTPPPPRRRVTCLLTLEACRSLPGAARYHRHPEDKEHRRRVYERARALRSEGATWRQIQKRLNTSKKALDTWASKHGWDKLT